MSCFLSGILHAQPRHFLLTFLYQSHRQTLQRFYFSFIHPSTVQRGGAPNSQFKPLVRSFKLELFSWSKNASLFPQKKKQKKPASFWWLTGAIPLPVYRNQWHVWRTKLAKISKPITQIMPLNAPIKIFKMIAVFHMRHKCFFSYVLFFSVFHFFFICLYLYISTSLRLELLNSSCSCFYVYSSLYLFSKLFIFIISVFYFFFNFGSFGPSCITKNIYLWSLTPSFKKVFKRAKRRICKGWKSNS